MIQKFLCKVESDSKDPVLTHTRMPQAAHVTCGSRGLRDLNHYLPSTDRSHVFSQLQWAFLNHSV